MPPNTTTHAPGHPQVDLSREAANLQRFNINFRRARGVSFPLPLYPLVSPDVLVESFEHGKHIRCVQGCRLIYAYPLLAEV
jgi:predicted unusual protein kinase regulating ubiquinone biosynthesis (AarF/ABC1/UbiB family)